MGEVKINLIEKVYPNQVLYTMLINIDLAKESLSNLFLNQHFP